MNTIPQITRALPKIRIPAWRRASPKKWNTRPLKMSPKAWPQKRMMSPKEATQSLGIASQPVIIRPSFAEPQKSGALGAQEMRAHGWCGCRRSSAYDQDLRVGRQEGLGEHV